MFRKPEDYKVDSWGCPWHGRLVRDGASGLAPYLEHPTGNKTLPSNSVANYTQLVDMGLPAESTHPDIVAAGGSLSNVAIVRWSGEQPYGQLSPQFHLGLPMRGFPLFTLIGGQLRRMGFFDISLTGASSRFTLSGDIYLYGEPGGSDGPGGTSRYSIASLYPSAQRSISYETAGQVGFLNGSVRPLSFFQNKVLFGIISAATAMLEGLIEVEFVPVAGSAFPEFVFNVIETRVGALGVVSDSATSAVTGVGQYWDWKGVESVTDTRDFTTCTGARTSVGGAGLVPTTAGPNRALYTPPNAQYDASHSITDALLAAVYDGSGEIKQSRYSASMVYSATQNVSLEHTGAIRIVWQLSGEAGTSCSVSTTEDTRTQGGVLTVVAEASSRLEVKIIGFDGAEADSYVAESNYKNSYTYKNYAYPDVHPPEASPTSRSFTWTVNGVAGSAAPMAMVWNTTAATVASFWRTGPSTLYALFTSGAFADLGAMSFAFPGSSTRALSLLMSQNPSPVDGVPFARRLSNNLVAICASHTLGGAALSSKSAHYPGGSNNTAYGPTAFASTSERSFWLSGSFNPITNAVARGDTNKLYSWI